ncbi:MAG: hypothetical protein HN348_32585, partial [Proteobacteria bacterium]|nr:hypothetical protein [Pseudomonadota bacterium]
KRQTVVEELARELLFERIAKVIPVLPVPLLSMALLQDGDQDEDAIIDRVGLLLKRFREAGALVRLGRSFLRIQHQRLGGELEDVPTAELDALDHEEAEKVFRLASFALLRRRVLRQVLTPTGRGVEVVSGSEDVVEYYANSICHHLKPYHDEMLLQQ